MDTQDNQIPTQVTIHDVPSKVRIPLPGKVDAVGSTIMAWLGYGIFGIGALFIVFGPDKIYYNAYEGMNFLQFLQAYPGPIASVGLLIGGLASKMGNSADAENAQAFSQAINDAIQIEDHELPEGYKLSLDPTDEPGVFYISFVEADEDGDNTTEPNSDDQPVVSLEKKDAA